MANWMLRLSTIKTFEVLWRKGKDDGNRISRINIKFYGDFE